jgi:hypothetical protein
MAVNVKIIVFWDVIQCSLVDKLQNCNLDYYIDDNA